MLPPQPPAPGLGQQPAPPPQRGAVNANAPTDQYPSNLPLDEEGDPEANVSPEEQDQYDQFVGNALNLIAAEGNEKAGESVVSMLSAGSDPVEALATAAVYVVDAVEKSASKSGMKITGETMLHGGQEITEHLAELAESKGIHTFTDEELETGFLKAVDHYKQMNKETMDPEAAKADLQALNDAPPAVLEGALPGMDKMAGQEAPQQGQQAPPPPPPPQGA